MSRLHSETHLIHRIGWLRAAVLGANDGIVSTASLLVGVSASGADHAAVLVAGLAGLVAGAMSMAAGEYVSVSSQTDTEMADLTREKGELASQWDLEVDELTGIYTQRGVDAETARKVAEQMMKRDALATHAREELGISDLTTARPVQAALTSALTFSVGRQRHCWWPGWWPEAGRCRQYRRRRSCSWHCSAWSGHRRVAPICSRGRCG